MKIGALEAGGTKMVCAVGNEKGMITDQITIPTRTPEITIPKIINYFKLQNIDALGIGCFGPVELDKKSKNYGFITSSPKLPWCNYDMVGKMKSALSVPIGFDTDVNAAALGEATWGSSLGLANSIYITIGTGVGVGIITNGKLLHGMLHPEAGHLLLKVRPEDNYKGRCPYHKNCLEGLASGPAIEERWGKKGIELGEEMNVWKLEAYYIGQAIVNYILTLSPEKIIVGGGVMHQRNLISLIRKEVKQQLNEYIRTFELDDIENYIVLPSLNDNQGIMGAIQLGLSEYFEA